MDKKDPVREIHPKVLHAVKYERELRNFYVNPTIKLVKEAFRKPMRLQKIIEILENDRGIGGGWRDRFEKEARHAQERLALQQELDHLKSSVKTFAALFGINVEHLFRLSPDNSKKVAKYLLTGGDNIDEQLHSVLLEKFRKKIAEKPLNQSETMKFFETEGERFIDQQGTQKGYQLRRFTRSTAARYIGMLTREKHRLLGIKRYRWITVGDDRVRERHMENHGKIFEWSDEKPGKSEGPPGFEWNCRCSARPIFDQETIIDVKRAIDQKMKEKEQENE